MAIQIGLSLKRPISLKDPVLICDPLSHVIFQRSFLAELFFFACFLPQSTLGFEPQLYNYSYMGIFFCFSNSRSTPNQPATDRASIRPLAFGFESASLKPDLRRIPGLYRHGKEQSWIKKK